MSGFTCPYCGMIMALNDATFNTQYPAFDSPQSRVFMHNKEVFRPSSIAVDFYKCPNCEQYTIGVTGRGSGVQDVRQLLRPISLAKQYPDYIPQQIREDYAEACAILYRSPKASATLARRCLQGMIRDYWGISKRTLYDEISELREKLQPDLWMALDNLRQLGNIGAHMEADTNVIVNIDPDEAEKLIQLIELLMKEWYINRAEREQLFGDILRTNEAKQAQRKGEG